MTAPVPAQWNGWITLTADKIKNSRRLSDLAAEAYEERQKWASHTIRDELLHIGRQLDAASREALTASDLWSDSWAEAGTLTIRKYMSARKLIEHVE